jgi:trimethylamine--corrinoid protein Co-methyltransferase
MRTGCMPYGRPEQTLTALAMSQIADALGALDAGIVGHGTAAKGADIEAGLNKGFAAGLQLALFGRVEWHFGIFSTDEIYDPRLIIIENEFVDSLKRLARGFEVTKDTLAYDVIREVGPGGQFLSHPHTLEHFRKELWLPDLFNGMYLEGWMAAGRPDILNRAREKVLEILQTHHPRGIRPETQEKLLSLLDRFAADLGLADYRRPADLPE